MTTCTVPDCDRAARCKGYCGMHWARLKRHGTTDLPPRKTCAVPACSKPYKARGYCEMHYQRVWKHGDPNTLLPVGLQRKQPGSGGWSDPKGYRLIQVNGSPAREHRWVMEQALGRPLRRDETVHHINGDRSDNRPENLELWSSFQPSGQRIPDKVEYALEILSRYAPHMLSGVNVA